MLLGRLRQTCPWRYRKAKLQPLRIVRRLANFFLRARYAAIDGEMSWRAVSMSARSSHAEARIR